MAEALLILGNGFDIDLGIKTKYEDFMNCDLFTELRQPSDKTKERSRLAGFLYEEYRRKKPNWYDIEIKLGEYSNRILNFDPHNLEKFPEDWFFNIDLETFEREFMNLNNALKDYLTSLNKTWNSNDIAFRTLLKFCKTFPTGRIVSFNYTSISRVILQGRYSNEVFDIHGTIRNENGIVFGVADKMVDSKHVFLIKATQSGYNYNIDLNNLMETSNKIFFFGYSLGETDKDHFDDFFVKYSSSSIHKKEMVFSYMEQKDKRNYNTRISDLCKGEDQALRKNINIKFIKREDFPNYFHANADPESSSG